MTINDLVLVQGLRDTRATFEQWNRHPWPVLRSWLLLGTEIAVALLFAIYVVAKLSTPDPTPVTIPGLTRPADTGDVAFYLYRNSLVLALHAMACVAGFIAGSALPLSAAHRTGVWRWIHDRAGRLAIAFVVGATTFSLLTQAFILGSGTSSLAALLGLSQGELLLTALPHALPELTVLFVPLAAWLIASRQDRWDQLLAATFVTVAIALPVLVASATVEAYVWPELLRAAMG